MKCSECRKSTFLMSFKLDDGRVLCPDCYHKIKDSLPKKKPPLATTILNVLALLFYSVGFFMIGSEMTDGRLITEVLLAFAGTGFLLAGQMVSRANRKKLNR